MQKRSSRRAKACDISTKTKNTVWERDGHRCILCGNPQAMPNAHFIPRSHGGLGVEQNVVTLCRDCHNALDNSTQRPALIEDVRHYLKKCYPNLDESKLIYKR